MLISISGVNKI